MRILHLMLSNYYIDGYNYQENVLPEINRQHGHEVMIIASTETFSDKKRLTYLPEGSYSTESGIPVRRVDYAKILPHFLAKKIRAYKKWLPFALDFNPDVVLWHGLAAWDLRLLPELKKRLPAARIYLDSHEDFHNSAKNVISKLFLHKLIYRYSLRPALKVAEKVLYISEETKDFDRSVYKVPDEMLEFFPLGAIVIPEDTRSDKSMDVRRRYGIGDGQIVLLHTGKMDEAKKTLEIVRAFSSIPDARLRLMLAGSVSESIRDQFDKCLAADSRIAYLGWKTAGELMDLLCACDLYLQPGTQSATLQNALGASAPVAVYPYKSHKPYVVNNGYFVRDEGEVTSAIKDILERPDAVVNMRKASYSIASSLLDYQELARRLYR